MFEPRQFPRRAIAGMRASHVALVIAVVLALGLGFASSASAHAELSSTSPTAGSVVATAPSQVVLTFSESIDTVPDSIRVLAADGGALAVGEVRQDLGDDTIAVDLPALDDGTYVVAWRAISGDSHPVQGAFIFSVGAPSTVDPSVVDKALSDNQPARSAEVWVSVGRWASYLGIAVVIGAITVLGLWLPSSLRSRRAGALLLVGAATAVAGTALMISAQASLNVGDALRWGEVIATRSGRWWLVRLIIVALAIPAILIRSRLRRTSWWVLGGAVAATGLLAVVAAGGHAVSGRFVLIGFIATVIHLAAMSAWVGGLAALAVVVPRHRIVRTAFRFSPLGLASVLALAVTGSVNAWRQSDSWSGLVDSHYGSWLIVKLVLLTAVVAIAAISRWLLTQAVSDETATRLRRTVTAEVVGILVVMVATAGLVSSPPPVAGATSNAIASATVVVGSRSAQIVLEPPVTGGTTMHVYVSSLTGSLDSPKTITVSATLAARQIGPIDLPVTVESPGHVTVYDANLPIAGTWSFTVSARYGEFEQVDFTATLDVR